MTQCPAHCETFMEFQSFQNTLTRHQKTTCIQLAYSCHVFCWLCFGLFRQLIWGAWRVCILPDHRFFFWNMAIDYWLSHSCFSLLAGTPDWCLLNLDSCCFCTSIPSLFAQDPEKMQTQTCGRALWFQKRIWGVLAVGRGIPRNTKTHWPVPYQMKQSFGMRVQFLIYSCGMLWWCWRFGLFVYVCLTLPQAAGILKSNAGMLSRL